MMYTILHAIFPIFILIGIGAILQWILPKQTASSKLLCKVGLGSCHTWTSILNTFALYLALPALIFSSLISAENIRLVPLSIIGYNVLFLIVMMGLVRLLTTLLRFPPALANTYFFGAFFGNIAYIGLAFLTDLYPISSGAISIIIAVHIAIAFSIGIWVLEHDHPDQTSLLTRLLKNPLLLSALLGFLVLALHIPLPAVLVNAIDMLGKSAVGVVLIAVGMFMIEEWKIDQRSMLHALAISGLKLFIMPLLFFLGALVLNPSLVLDLSILEAAMPVALTNFALAERYRMDKHITAHAIILSTLISFLTITLWSFFVL